MLIWVPRESYRCGERGEGAGTCVASQAGDCSKMGGDGWEESCGQGICSTPGARNAGRAEEAGGRWGSALQKRRRRRVRRTRKAGTMRGRPRTARDLGFGEGFPASQAHRRCDFDPCRVLSSPPESGLSLVFWHFELPSELSPATGAPLFPSVVSPLSPLEALPSASLQPGSPPSALAHAHMIQCMYGMSKFLIS